MVIQGRDQPQPRATVPTHVATEHPPTPQAVATRHTQLTRHRRGPRRQPDWMNHLAQLWARDHMMAQPAYEPAGGGLDTDGPGS